jgi:hypothetical protein
MVITTKKLEDYLDKETIEFYEDFPYINLNNKISALYIELMKAIKLKDKVSEEQAIKITEEILF